MISVNILRRGDGPGLIDRIQRALLGSRGVKLGFPDGTDPEILQRAIWNEFGTSRGIPERPFFRNAMRDNAGKYRKFVASRALKVLRGQTTVEQSMKQLLLIAQGDIQESITALNSPANAPSTIAQKGSSNPLIDTGAMRQAVVGKLEGRV